MKVLRRHDGLAGEVDKHEVGVGAALEATLAAEAQAPRRAGARELGELDERQPARVVAGVEQQREQRLGAGDAAPDGEEVAAVVVALELGRRRRVVGGDERDGAVMERGPEGVALGRRAERRRALGDRAEALGVLLVEHEVVRSRLARGVDAAGARLRHARDAAAGRDVHNVQRAAGLFGEQQRPADRLDLGDRRARAQVVADPGAPLAAGAGGERGRDRLALRVDGDRQAQARGGAHAPQEREGVGHRELGDAAGRHERLEANDAARRELVEALDVVRDEPAPQREVDERGALRGGALAVERGGVDRGRLGVERHVDGGRRAAGGERAGAGLEALPRGAARVVEVHVGVDHAGEHVEAGGVDLFARRALFERGRDRDDPPVGDADVGAAHAVGPDERAAADRQGERAHRERARRSRRRLVTSIATATSAASTASAGWWLMPPAQRTNSIATSHRRDITAASWPAPLGRRATRTRASATAASSCAVSAGAHATEAVACTSLHVASTPRAAAIAYARSRRSAHAASRVVSSRWRTSTVRVARAGMTLLAPGWTSSSPTVATSPSTARAVASTVPIHSAAAASASRRSAIGTVPAWPASPSKTISARVWPAMPVTTPTGRPSASSTGPCSMWTST